jgi:cytoskeletal protein CcmA (bactofilin family)
LVGGNTKICGDVHFTGGLHVDGVIEGNVIAESDSSVLTTSEKGQINGNVTVHNIVLNGEVVGDVHALHHIELAPNARVTGNVYYNVIEMAMGAEVNGNLIHTKNGEKPDSNVTQAAKEALGPQPPMDKVVNK